MTTTVDPPPAPPPVVIDEDFRAFSASARSLDAGEALPLTVPPPQPAVAVVPNGIENTCCGDGASSAGQDSSGPLHEAATTTTTTTTDTDSSARDSTEGIKSTNQNIDNKAELSAEVEQSRDSLLQTLSQTKLESSSLPDSPATPTPSKPILSEAPASPIRGSRYVTPKDFELLKVIGMGAFGKVLQCRNKASGEILAMKVISKRLLRRKTSYVENIQAERDILTKCDHPFIVNMRCSFQTREKVFIVMDFLSGGELFLRLGREGIFRERTASFYVAEITSALEHLHSRGILHRDLKPENILLGSDGHVCVTDFGLAKDLGPHEDGRARTVCGTQEYMAPEMVIISISGVARSKGYGRAADFWSLGCICYEMLAGRPPFESRKGSKELFKLIMNQRVKMPDGASAAACKLLKGLLNRDTMKRLGAAKSTMFEVGGIAQLKQMDFFAGLDWTKLEKKEIDPPERFEVENEQDLKHFHEEFTKMTIPRSVKEMNKEDFRPRHIKSDMFRGFSFVAENFQLPDRQKTEEEEYWNNVEADAYSDSVAASSAFGDGDVANLASLEPQPVQPAKKKRPPRKKKKKKAVGEETASVASDVASQKGKEGDAAASSATPPAAPTKSLEEQADRNHAAESGNVELPNAAAASPAKPLRPLRPTHPSPEEKKVIAAAVPPTLSLPPPQSQTPRSPAPKPAAPVWETVKKPNKPAPHAAASNVSNARPVVGAAGWNRPHPSASPRQPPSAPPLARAAQPPPGSWAAKTISARQQAPAPQTRQPTASANNQADGHGLRASASSWQPTGVPASDWRSHSMPISPRHSKKIPAPPPPQADDFPTLGGMKKSASSTSTASSGAWGAKR